MGRGLLRPDVGDTQAHRQEPCVSECSAGAPGPLQAVVGMRGTRTLGMAAMELRDHSFLWGQDEARAMKQHWLKVCSAPFSVFWKSQDAILQATWGSPQQDKATYARTAMATGQRKDTSRSKSWVVCIGGRGWVFIFVCFSILETVFQVKT